MAHNVGGSKSKAVTSRPSTSGNFQTLLQSFEDFPKAGGRDPQVDRLFGNVRPRTFGPDTAIISSNVGDEARGFGATAGLNLGTKLSRAFQASETDLQLAAADRLLGTRGALEGRSQEAIAQAFEQFDGGGAGLSAAGTGAARGIAEGIFGSKVGAKLETERGERERGELTGLLGNLFIEPSVALAEGGEIEAVRQIEGAAGRSASAAAKKQQKKQAIAGFVAAVLPILIGLCWVARRVLGTETNDWMHVRDYLIEEAPTNVLLAYARHGAETAKRLTPAEALDLQPVFEAIVKERTNA